MTDNLVKRLRKVELDLPNERIRWYRNPDGHEAADRIEQLEAALRKTHTVLFMAQQYRGYEGGPLSEPSADLAEREARAALAGEKKDD